MYNKYFTNHLKTWDITRMYKQCVQGLSSVGGGGGGAWERGYRQCGSAMNSFIDQGEFVSMKMLSDHKAPCCDKHQFQDILTVST